MKHVVTIIPATIEHVAIIAKDVRAPDVAEIWASSRQVPERAMQSGLKYSERAMTGLVDGEPVCMWGVVTESLVGRVGIPWMIGTSKLDTYARIFLRECRKPQVEMFEGYGMLVNYVDARNTRAIKWLRFMGFDVEPKPVPYGISGLPFHRFIMREETHV